MSANAFFSWVVNRQAIQAATRGIFASSFWKAANISAMPPILDEKAHQRGLCVFVAKVARPGIAALYGHFFEGSIRDPLPRSPTLAD
jgi:hypothetical protein